MPVIIADLWTQILRVFKVLGSLNCGKRVPQGGSKDVWRVALLGRYWKTSVLARERVHRVPPVVETPEILSVAEASLQVAT